MLYSKRLRIFLREQSRWREPVDVEGCGEMVVSFPTQTSHLFPLVRPRYPAR